MKATNIQWDTDGDNEALETLPTEIEIPEKILKDCDGEEEIVEDDTFPANGANRFTYEEYYNTEEYNEIIENGFDGVCFFCNSGAEANEAAIKLARKWGKGEKYHIITMVNSFHGRTMGALTATAQEKYQKAFMPLLEGFSAVPLGDLEALEAAIRPETCAIMLEPIQGESGINVPTQEYMDGVQALCKKYNILLILDEVQTGNGRTGKLYGYMNYGITPDIGRTGKPFCFQNFGLEPDIISLAKAIANGVPMGAIVAKAEVADCFQPGDHASTFGGTPIATAAGVAACNILLDDELFIYFMSDMETSGLLEQQKGKT